MFDRFVCFGTKHLVIFLSLWNFSSYGQVSEVFLDENYLEDQLYFGITYNQLSPNPSGVFQDGRSYGTRFGFIKDFPLNKERSMGLGLGLGYAYDAYAHNLLLDPLEYQPQFRIGSGANDNRHTFHSLSLPFELRWRTSTPAKERFWRVYTGLTFSYVFRFEARHKNTSHTVVVNDLDLVERVQYALTAAVGYGTWNFYANASLRPLFKKIKWTESDDFSSFQSLSLGLMFYVF